MAKFSVEEVSAVERRIQIEVEAEAVEQEIAVAYRNLSMQVRIPGFRPGKTPRRILESRFKDQVEKEVVQSIVQGAIREALSSIPNLNLAASPRFTNEPLKVGEPFRFQATIEVVPPVDPKDYLGIEIKKPKVDITDAKVAEELERLQKAMTRFIPIEDRSVAIDGDHALVDFEGFIDGKVFPNGKGQDRIFEIAPGEMQEGFMPGLIGAAIQETRELEYTFPEDPKHGEMAGKTAQFKVLLKGLRSKKTPTLDDAFAKEVGAGQTLADLQDIVRKELAARETAQVERQAREQLMAKIVERNPLEVPPSMIERALAQMTRNVLERLRRQKVDAREVDLDRMREQLRPAALIEVKEGILIDAISQKEQVEVSSEDLDTQIKEYAEKIGADLEKVRAHLLRSQDELDLIRYQIRHEKTVALLLSRASVVEG